MNYLLKTEPTVYSFADLQREQTTIWDGVTNPVAVKNLRGMKPGEQLIIYHTGDEKSAVGTATVVSVDTSDPRNPQVKIKVGKPLAKPVTLGRGESQQTLCRLTAGAARALERRSFNRRSAQVHHRRLRHRRNLHCAFASRRISA